MPVSRRRFAFLVVLTLALAVAPGGARQPSPATVRLHVGGDPLLRPRVTAYLRAALQPARAVVVVERDAEYVLSVIVLPVASGGFAVSTAALSAHTDERLTARARAWGLDAGEAERVREAFRGSGVLLDQRVLTGPDLEILCRDAAGAFVTDTLAGTRAIP